MKSLSTWVDLKGSEYDEVMNIMYDEVLIDPTSNKRYLDNEVEAMLNFIFSVFRRREGCHAYLLSNAGNFNNPYFAFLRFYDNNGKRFYHLKQYATLIEFPPHSAFETEEEKQSGFIICYALINTGLTQQFKEPTLFFFFCLKSCLW